MNRLLSMFCVLVLTSPAIAQGSAADYLRADSLPGDWPNLLRNAELSVRWIDASTVVYPYTLSDGTEEWRTVDLETRLVRPAFDHEALAAVLEEAGAMPQTGLRITWFEPDGDRVIFMLGGDARVWAWEEKAARLEQADPSGLPERFGLAPVRTDRTRSGGPSTSLFVVNATPEPVRLIWLDHEARSREYARIEPGGSHRQNTYSGHAWRVIGEDNAEIGTYVASERPGVVFVRGPVEPPIRERASAAHSPDGRFRVVFRDHQVVLRSEEDGSETVLTSDGTREDHYMGPVRWSPDSERFVVMRTKPGDERTVHIVESSPRDQLQPKLISFQYRKPGDRVDVSLPRLFVAATGKMIEPDDQPIKNPWSVGRVEWAPDGSRFFYLYNERGHQTVQYVAVDASTGTARVVADERSDTFIDWTNKVFMHRIEATDELIWMSERSGWSHLYMYDMSTGKVKHAITSGDWVVRAVDRVDEERREVWLRVMGINDGEDPYHIHHARVGLDGSSFMLLTEGDGTHRIDFGPDGAHFVDVWSRADQPPVTEIRRSSDGSRVAVLAEADASELSAAGWTPPERFAAKGRDGETAIWGLIHRPTNFDASKKYPVIESIYAGPHGQHVPKAFSVWSGTRSLAELGFVVVQIDGMGTNWRSKAFHDVAWKNLKDAGFPDRIAWMKAAAVERPWMDLDRVGIYGVSAGGQSALGALLFHGDFYTAAVADCGCHDNRMDKIWWNEQWMGWPVGPHYAESSNVTHAHRLTGKLLLIVGETDRNVDPASTM
ncbi:MAG: DPP IV N-terminal domain-containing protein, partial [Phycisphaerales bacterium]